MNGDQWAPSFREVKWSSPRWRRVSDSWSNLWCWWFGTWIYFPYMGCHPSHFHIWNYFPFHIYFPYILPIHELYPISYMGCHPPHWLSYFSRWLKLVKTTNQNGWNMTFMTFHIFPVFVWDRCHVVIPPKIEQIPPVINYVSIFSGSLYMLYVNTVIIPTNALGHDRQDWKDWTNTVILRVCDLGVSQNGVSIIIYIIYIHIYIYPRL